MTDAEFRAFAEPLLCPVSPDAPPAWHTYAKTGEKSPYWLSGCAVVVIRDDGSMSRHEFGHHVKQS